jgi:hypothetical protein
MENQIKTVNNLHIFKAEFSKQKSILNSLSKKINRNSNPCIVPIGYYLDVNY